MGKYNEYDIEDREKKKGKGFLNNLKRLFLVITVIGIGILLSLSGLNLIEISPELNLYSGLGLLAAGFIYYFIY